MKDSSPSPFRYELWDLLVLPAIVGVYIARGGIEAIRLELPAVFAFWVAIRQRNVKEVPLINPFTVGLVAGMVWFCVYEVAKSAGQGVTLTAIGVALMLGGLVGFAMGLMASIQVAMALVVWDAIKPLIPIRRSDSSSKAAARSPGDDVETERRVE